jgi:FAD/FMN-containing dehydrogenase
VTDLTPDEPRAPATLDDAIQALGELWANRIPTRIVSRPGTTATRSDAVAVSLGRLDRIVRLDPTNLAVVVEAGVPVARVRSAAETVGLWCPPLRWLPDDLPIGAAVAGNRGHRSRRYGTVGDHVLGTELVCPAVGRARHGGLAIKNATGYNLSALVVGSRGRLAVILQIVLRLVPIPRERTVWQFRFPADMIFPASQMLAGGWSDDSTVRPLDWGAAAVEVCYDARDRVGCLWLEADGPSIALDRLTERAERFGGEALTGDVPSAYPENNQTWWRGSVPPSNVGAAAASVAATLPNGSGSIRFEATGGALDISAEPAPLELKRVLARLTPPAGSVETLRRRLQRAFDPDGLLATDPLPGSND